METLCTHQSSERIASHGDLKMRTGFKAEAVRCAVGIFQDNNAGSG